jgi:hypothetical protein
MIFMIITVVMYCSECHQPAVCLPLINGAKMWCPTKDNLLNEYVLIGYVK